VSFDIFTEKPAFSLAYINQVHGNTIVTVQEALEKPGMIEADGLIDFEKSTTPLAIRTADCLAIAYTGDKGRAIVHAGWRGLALEIHLSPTLDSLQTTHIHIGPHIRACCFEVSLDFLENFPNSPYFIHRNKNIFFDLTAKAKTDLLKRWPDIQLTIDPRCTMCSGDLHSFRRDKGPDRNWNVLT
jgi:hypothetical protein